MVFTFNAVDPGTIFIKPICSKDGCIYQKLDGCEDTSDIRIQFDQRLTYLRYLSRDTRLGLRFRA